MIHAMQELVGPESDEAAFSAFLDSWPEHLAVRVAEVGEALGSTDWRGLSWPGATVAVRRGRCRTSI